MPNHAKSTDAYLKTRVLTASPEQLRLMLLDGAIKFARQARTGQESKDYEASFEGFSQARAIVMELIVTIDPEPDPELAGRVQSVLSFIFSEMVEASMSKEPSRMDEAIRLLEYERETWALFVEQLSKERAGAEVPDSLSEPKPDARPKLSVEG